MSVDNTVSGEMLPVEQRHREAAAAALMHRWLKSHGARQSWMDASEREILIGRHDKTEDVQVFARFERDLIAAGNRLLAAECDLAAGLGYPSIFEALEHLRELKARSTPSVDGEMLEALRRLANLTPASANAHTAADLCLTVRAIAESAIARAESTQKGKPTS